MFKTRICCCRKYNDDKMHDIMVHMLIRVSHFYESDNNYYVRRSAANDL